jgi:peptidoglycan DL-endopeptidase CwlO
VHTLLAVRKITGNRKFRIGWLTGASLATVLAVIGIGGSAGAAPQPTIAQVQKKLAAIESKASKLGQQYDQVLSQLALANQRFTVLNKETARYRSTFYSMRQQIGKLAAVAYEQGGVDSPLGLLTSDSPQQVLNQSSILAELTVADSAQISQYLSASRQLLTAQQAAARARRGILKLKHALGKRLAVLNTLKQQQLTLLAELTPTQRTGVGPGGGTGGTTYHGPTATQAEQAVAFAYHQIGCPYVWGGTGPCADGFDCSGLMQSAWSSAGIVIPRVSNDQIGSLPAVPLHTASGAFTEKYLQPGDILGFNGNTHVGMYVGGGYLIDAPVPGEDVEKVALAGWYLQNLDGAVRP